MIAAGRMAGRARVRGHDLLQEREVIFVAEVVKTFGNPAEFETLDEFRYPIVLY